MRDHLSDHNTLTTTSQWINHRQVGYLLCLSLSKKTSNTIPCIRTMLELCYLNRGLVMVRPPPQSQVWRTRYK